MCLTWCIGELVTAYLSPEVKIAPVIFPDFVTPDRTFKDGIRGPYEILDGYNVRWELMEATTIPWSNLKQFATTGITYC